MVLKIAYPPLMSRTTCMDRCIYFMLYFCCVWAVRKIVHPQPPHRPRDKSEIRPLYKRHKDLERELARLMAESPPPASAPADARSPSSPSKWDATMGDIDPLATPLSPTSSTGNVSTGAPSRRGENGSGDDDDDDDDDEDKGSKQDGGDEGARGSSDERRRSGDVTSPGPRGRGSTAALLLPLPSLSPDRSVAREVPVGGAAARSDGNPTEGVDGSESGNQSLAAEEKSSSQEGEAAAPQGDAVAEDQDEKVKSSFDEGDAYPRRQESEDLGEKGLLGTSPGYTEGENDPLTSSKPAENALSGASARSSSSESVKPGTSIDVADLEDDENKQRLSSSRRSFLATVSNNSSNSRLPFGGDEIKKIDDDGDGGDDGGDSGESGSDSNTMTAQEARVRRMRARFLDMKSLLDGDEQSRPLSPKATGENTLGYGLAAAVIDEDDGASLSPVKGIRCFCLVASIYSLLDLSLPVGRRRCGR